MVLFGPGVTFAQQATLTDDAHTESSKPNKNFGAAEVVQVSGSEKGFLKFKLTPNLPTGTTGSRVGKATLKLFVSAVTGSGSIDIYRVAGTWAEGDITDGAAPSVGGLEGTIVVGVEQVGKWVTVDITQLVKDWLDGALLNNGVALVAPAGGAQASFDSKENVETSHEALLEIALNHAATADTATNFSGNLAGEVTGTQSATVVAAVGGQTAAVVAGGAAAANAATDNNTPNTIVKRDAAGSFSAGTVNAETQYNLDGKRALSIAGANNLFAGEGAGTSNTTGNDNAFFGASAGVSNTTGDFNAFFGSLAGLLNTTGGNNAFFGTLAGLFNTTGTFNAFFGRDAGSSNTTGGNNAFFGSRAGFNNRTGSDNAIFGASAGASNTTGRFNTFFGTNADANFNNLSNATALGANAQVGCSNCLVLGSIAGVNGATASTNVGIGLTTPIFRLHLAENSAAKPGSASWTVFSDRRLKRDIRPYTDGLATLLQFRPVWYRYNGQAGLRSDGDYVGIIAQEARAVAPYTVSAYRAKLHPQDAEAAELLRFDGGALTFMTINAVRELHAQVAGLRGAEVAEVARLRAENAAQRKRLAGQQQRLSDLEKRLAALEERVSQLTRK